MDKVDSAELGSLRDSYREWLSDCLPECETNEFERGIYGRKADISEKR
jgi:hypothetical protein